MKKLLISFLLSSCALTSFAYESFTALGPSLTYHENQSIYGKYNEQNAGLGLRYHHSKYSYSNLKNEHAIYIFKDSFNAVSLNLNTGASYNIWKNNHFSFDSAFNVHALYKGVSWNGRKDWRAGISARLDMTHSSGIGLGLSYYPNIKNENLGSIATLTIQYKIK